MKKKQQEVPAALDKITDVVLNYHRVSDDDRFCPKPKRKTAIRAKDKLVYVDVWSHPEWDMKLIVEANAASAETAHDNLHPDHVPELLTKRRQTMTRGEFESLPEWDG